MDETPEEKIQRKALLKNVRGYIKAAGLNDTTLEKRATGLLSMLANPRLQDRLAPLVGEGRVRADDIEAWKQLRHPGAHGTVMQLTGIDAVQMNLVLRKIRQTSTLMYHICFYLIGYQGPHTNYSITGWPTIPYPFPKPQDPPLETE